MKKEDSPKNDYQYVRSLVGYTLFLVAAVEFSLVAITRTPNRYITQYPENNIVGIRAFSRSGSVKRSLLAITTATHSGAAISIGADGGQLDARNTIESSHDPRLL